MAAPFILGILGGALLCGVAAGGFLVSAACWLLNEWTLKHCYDIKSDDGDVEWKSLAEPDTSPSIENKSLEPGGWLFGTSPWPNYFYCCLVEACVIAVIGIMILTIDTMLWHAFRLDLIRERLGWIFAGVAFMLACGIHIFMLRLDLLRGFLVTLIMLMVWWAVGITLVAICFAAG